MLSAKIELPLEMIQEADRSSAYVVWTAESYGSDAMLRPWPGWAR
ncbi:hypothetical protein [Candidatus Amarolinea dominans]